ncbi:hypothetical protein LAC81_37645 (plasmid) [Ensifer adhaerens]|uniref:hypothetical protein n=1 Tax=Ensifer adhaerens TaxID=106592 RepID=UPI001CBFCC41|nr:hypothetical protein [Ensifer adhaerens]UAX98060.1 hypothetical protein LAC78_38945 [Ensifer adhaerens]UAY05441.1 hypothetical protein LAC80_37660 [Ensifer adhaerens]UAY12819.1 hypothetical protein LAC81_37645 [Ensifer adhaerens]
MPKVAPTHMLSTGGWGDNARTGKSRRVEHGVKEANDRLPDCLTGARAAITELERVERPSERSGIVVNNVLR